MSGNSDDMERSWLRTWCGTWNVCSMAPPASGDLTEWLGLDAETSDAFDIYAVGIQEANANPIAWAGEYVVFDQWTVTISKLLASRGLCRVFTRRVVGLLILVFVRHPLLPFIDHLEFAKLRTGMTGKGVLVVRFRIRGMHIAFVNCHFCPHPENISIRNAEYSRVTSEIQFRDPQCRTLLEHQYLLWFGDFNYRVDRISMKNACQMITEKHIEELRKFDQLARERELGYCYSEFHEGLINFAPTYKFKVGKQEYDTSIERRLPSWCDRIQWKVNTDRSTTGEESMGHRPSLQLLSYQSHPFYCVSDHKPVSAQMLIAAPKAGSAPPSVTFIFPRSWSCQKDVTVCYQVAATVRTSNWDWIGLYQTGWEYTKDYVTYVWASSDTDDSVTARSYQIPLAGRYVPATPGHYQLVYHSSDADRGILGISDPFLVMPSDSNSDCPFVQPVYEDGKLITHAQNPQDTGV